MTPSELVGLKEIATKLKVKRATVDTWRRRGDLPEPTFTIGGRPAWRWAAIRRWARDTGRFPKEGAKK